MGVQADPRLARAAAQALERPKAPPPPAPTPRAKHPKSQDGWVEEARGLAAGAADLQALSAAIESFEGCPLKKGADKTVVFDGVVGAPVMVLGEGPGGEEDRRGLPFVGKAGQLLDRMLAAIGLSRQTNTFISNVNYWRPPGNRNPDASELAVCRPFVDRMVELAAPKLILAAGGVAATSLLSASSGIMRLRGKPAEFETPGGGRTPLLPILHPAYLLRRPQEKALAWKDLLTAQSMLADMGVEIS